VSRTAASRPLRRPLSLRREVAILVPVSLLLLLLLAAFTLLSYRNAVDLLIDARRGEAQRAARAAAADLAAGGDPAMLLADLRRRVPAVRRALLVDATGRTLAASGELPLGPPLAPFLADSAGAESAEPRAVGPDELLPDVVAALAALPPSPAGAASGRLLRVDLDAALLAAQRRGLTVLTVVVLVVGSAVGLLLILFLRHLLRPYDALLERARQVGGDEEADDVELLLSTFERGMAALARRGGEGADEARGGAGADADIAALERTLAASLESGLLLLDRDGGVMALNPVGTALLEVAAPVAGTPLGEALAPHPELVGLLAGAVRTGRPIQRHELSLETASGARTLGLTVHPLRRAAGGADAAGEAAEDATGGDGGSAPRGFLVLFADLTEVRRQADEARLADSLVRLGELAAGVAHELRNSLATLRGYLTLIERSPQGSPAGYVEEIRHEADHLQRVLEDFLAFARPGSARVEETSLAAVAERAAADPALGDTRVSVAAAAAPRLRGDPQLLERAVRNLLRNAAEAQRQAAAEGGAEGGVAVEVSVAPAADGGCELVVADRGAGVPVEIEDRLFQPFVTGRPDGVGLGLALAHRIVSLHGGSLRLEPRPGGGTRAVMHFPPDRIVTEGNDLGAAAPSADPL